MNLYYEEFPEDLQRILNIGAKVYNTKTKRQGKVVDNNGVNVTIDYGNSAKSEIAMHGLEEFKQMLLDDEVVSNSRLTRGSGSSFKVKPRIQSFGPKTWKGETPNVQSIPKPKGSKLETGYVNFKTGRFSKESKKGYTKIEYKKSTQKVTLEVDDDTLSKLKEMGLV